ncbi:MAG: inositol monophosphatase family protein, partial [Sphingomonas bacterium]
MRVTDAEIAFAETLAGLAGAAIRPYFRRPHGLEAKADASPVTLADRAAEQAMRAAIEARFPDDAIIG